MHYIAFGYEEAKRAGDKHDLDVFFGWEFTIRGSDFLTYGLDMEFLLANPYMDELGIERYSALIRKNGGYLAQAHPYRDEYYIEHNYPVEPHLIDGVEVYNSMDTKKANSLAFEFALKNDLPMQSGTDSHGRGTPLYRGIALQKRAKNINDIIEAIKSREAKLF
jgi:predicted metal-dependent phosphoesterase TrpH